MFSLLAGEALVELANTDVTKDKLNAAETAALATVGSEDQPSDAPTGPSILVLNDLWRYVPTYFQTVDAAQPRSEAGRRLLERRRRQIERQQQQQQQQQQQRKSAVTVTEADENQRGTLPVDQLLAYITNSASDNAAATSTSGLSTPCKGRRKKKQSTPNSDAVVTDSLSPKYAIDDAVQRQSENVRNGVRKKEPKPDNMAASEVAGDVADFVVVRRGRKQGPTAERSTQLQSGRHYRHKPTFCDSLDEFSLQDDNVTLRADYARDNTAVTGERSVTTTSASTKSSQTLPLSTKTTQKFEVSSQRTNLDTPTASSECHSRPVTLRYNDVVKGSYIRKCQQKPVVVDVSAETSTNYQYEEPYGSRTASSVDCVQTTKSPSLANSNGEQDNLITDVHPFDVSTPSLDHDSSTRQTKHIAVGRLVETVSCSTQTSSVDMRRYSTPSPSNNSIAVDDVTGNENLPRRPNAIVFLDAKSEKTDSDKALQEGSGLSFGSFDDVTSTSRGSGSCDSNKVTTKSESVGKCSDAATSPIKLSPTTPSSPTSETKSVNVASHCRRITPLCRTTGSSSSSTGAPVGIVPPIMHVETASGDADVSADKNSTRDEVSYNSALISGL